MLLFLDKVFAQKNSDETGINLAMTRLYARCEGGARVYDDHPGSKGKNITLIGAMSDEGVML